MLHKIDKMVQTLIFERFLPAKPPKFLLSQSQSLKQMLPYETVIEDERRSIFILSDGAVGTFWEIDPISHELKSESMLNEILGGFCKIFEATSGDRITYQIVYDSHPSEVFKVPSWVNNPKTFAQEIISQRIEAIKSLATNPGSRPRLMKRSLYLFLRVEIAGGDFEQRKKGNRDGAFLDQIEVLSEAVTTIRDQAKITEELIESCAKMNLVRKGADKLAAIVGRRLGHDGRGIEVDKERRLSDQVVRNNVEWTNDAVGVGNDTWEILSWSDQPNVQFTGMMAELLKYDVPVISVVNIRPVNNTRGLESLANAVKNGGDALKERQRDEVYETEKKLAYGEKLLSVSFHILLKNNDRKVTDPINLRIGDNICKQLGAATNIPLMVERFAAQAVFMACLPFCYSRKVAGFIGREARVLSSSAGGYLPMYCGTKGENRPCQLMQSRGGEAIWINPRCSPTNPHLAILGSSGGGKSFYLSNFITSEVASNPKALIFHIDCITSCEYLARSLGEDIGCNITKPPENFPNLFRGEITRERLPTIVGVVEVAVNLVASDRLSAAEKVVLSDAILKTFEDNLSFSEEVFKSGDESGLGQYVSGDGRRRVPRLSEIVNNFTSICQNKGVDDSVALSLKEKLLPLFGSGPYAIVFDREDYEDLNDYGASYHLYDLVGVQGDKTLATITSLIVIADVLRILSHKDNHGRKGLLIIDECGVNLSGKSDYLEAFVNEKWPTLRKKGIVCIGVTNKADHYADLPAPSTIWSISANKLILPMTTDDIVMAEKKRLIENKTYLELIRSLQKRKGQFAECIWIGESMSGTFSYVPTGFDYWTAVNQDHDVSNLNFVRKSAGSYQLAIKYLAEKYPAGVTCDYGDPRPFTEDEKTKIKKELAR